MTITNDLQVADTMSVIDCTKHMFYELADLSTLKLPAFNLSMVKAGNALHI